MSEGKGCDSGEGKGGCRVAGEKEEWGRKTGKNGIRGVRGEGKEREE